MKELVKESLSAPDYIQELKMKYAVVFCFVFHSEGNAVPLYFIMNVSKSPCCWVQKIGVKGQHLKKKFFFFLAYLPTYFSNL